jgi:hypothetical protein
MKPNSKIYISHLAAVVLVLGPLIFSTIEVTAGSTVFFDVNQIASLVSTGTISDTISSEGYLFTYTRDKLFTGGVGLTNPIGRTVRIPWPDGVEAQYVTSGPNPTKASITVRRVDGALFDLTSFTAKLLANAGAGRSIEIVPLMNGEEPLDNPLYFDVSGNYGQSFSYNTSPNYLGSTAALTNYDAYQINLTLDYALTALTLESAAPNFNHAPTNIVADNTVVLENQPAGSIVGTFWTNDPDEGDTFTYALVTGEGSADNGLFSMIDGDLLADASFNHEVKSNYSIRVMSTDQGLLSTQMVFVIEVLNADEPPPEIFMESEPANGLIVIYWAGIANHHYTIYQSSDLLNGFSVLQDNIPFNPDHNSYTDSVESVSQKFWMISTDP